MTSQRVERTCIRTGGYGRFRGEWVKRRLLAPTLARKFDISHWFPCGADGRADVWSRDCQNFSDGKFFLGMGGVRVELRYYQFLKFHAVIKKLLLDED